MSSNTAYLAGYVLSFDWIMVFVALKDHPILNFLSQRGSELVQAFGIGPFVFTLVWNEGDIDICLYRVRREDFEVEIAFIGIDSTVPSGNYSNVDFVQYIWENLDMNGCQMHALTILPGHSTQLLSTTWRWVWGGALLRNVSLYRFISKDVWPRSQLRHARVMYVDGSLPYFRPLHPTSWSPKPTSIVSSCGVTELFQYVYAELGTCSCSDDSTSRFPGRTEHSNSNVVTSVSSTTSVARRTVTQTCITSLIRTTCDYGYLVTARQFWCRLCKPPLFKPDCPLHGDV